VCCYHVKNNIQFLFTSFYLRILCWCSLGHWIINLAVLHLVFKEATFFFFFIIVTLCLLPLVYLSPQSKILKFSIYFWITSSFYPFQFLSKCMLQLNLWHQQSSNYGVYLDKIKDKSPATYFFHFAASKLQFTSPNS
jgi:hypothetical protein